MSSRISTSGSFSPSVGAHASPSSKQASPSAFSQLSPSGYSAFASNFSKVGNPQQPQESQEYEDITMLKLISKAKFPVYLVNSPAKNKLFALKVFGFENSEPHAYYRNEARFAVLNHPNIIKIAYTEDETSMPIKGKDKQVSCILMEYAPHGDFFDFVKSFKDNLSEKLIRTYFRQLIEGIEYLHNNGVCHLDLKLENLLVGEDYQLKVADFDLSYMTGDTKVLTRGTRFYRAPELRASKCKNGPAADVYSAAILLFVLKSGGLIPHAEDNLYQGIDLFNLMNTNTEDFFKKHCTIQQKSSSFFDSNFKELFTSMIKLNPDKRASIKDIKNSRWYKGPVYTKEELKTKVKRVFNH